MMIKEEALPEAPNFLPPGVAAAVAFIITIVFTLTTTLTPIRSDNDCWWHVKTGQYIVENGIPETDVFSYTAADHEWHNHEWLAQVAFYYAWAAGDQTELGGWRGVILFKSMVILLTNIALLLLAYRLSKNWLIALLVVVLAIAIGRRMYMPRPPVITNLLLVGQLWLLLGVSHGWIRKAWLWLLVPYIALWTNLHGGWMAAGVIYGLFVIGMVLKQFAAKLPPLPFTHPKESVSLKLLVPLGIGLLIATFMNPFTYHLYALPGRVLGDRDLVSSIGELASPNFYYVIDFELAILMTLVLALYTRFKPGFFELMIYLFFLHQAIQHVRHLSLFSIMMVPLTAQLLTAATAQGAVSLGNFKAPLAKIPNALVLILSVYTLSWVTVNPREGGQWLNPMTAASYPGRNLQYLQEDLGYIPERFPARLADLIELADLEGNMWNENNYAGYLIWRLSPEKHRVFSDSRFDIFGGDIMRAEREISMGNTRLLDKYDVQWLITSYDKVLSLILEDTEGWVPVARFQVGKWELWIRDTEKNQDMMQRVRNIAPMTGAEPL